MEQRDLRVLETNKTFFNKISNTISKLLVPTKLGINNMMILMKRNSVVKAFANYVLSQQITDAQKKEIASKKYENAYSLYLESIDKNIMDSLYKKVKNGIANNFEKNALANYYSVVSLKNDSYLEYKYKKQEYLLKIDYETASNQKKETQLKSYKEFYVSKMDSLYKGLLKNYSVDLTDNIKKDISSEKTFEKIFSLLDNYLSEILPIKISLKEENQKYQQDYDKYEEVSIGKLNEQDVVIKKMILLDLSRKFFVHSLPLGATESCYLYLIESLRNFLLTSETNKSKKEKTYSNLIRVMENYYKNLVSGKVYWDNPTEKEEFKKWWDKYNSILEISNEEERNTKKGILFIKKDLKSLYLNESKNKKIINIYKQYLVELGAIRQIKNKCKTINAQLRGIKIWNTQK